MARIYDPADETDINDQRCGNCMWWNRDPGTDERECWNRHSERHGEYTAGEGWCWCWRKDRHGNW